MNIDYMVYILYYHKHSDIQEVDISWGAGANRHVSTCEADVQDCLGFEDNI